MVYVYIWGALSVLFYINFFLVENNDFERTEKDLTATTTQTKKNPEDRKILPFSIFYSKYTRNIKIEHELFVVVHNLFTTRDFRFLVCTFFSS